MDIKTSRQLDRLAESGMKPLEFNSLPLSSEYEQDLRMGTFQALDTDPKYGTEEFIGEFIYSDEARNRFLSALELLNPGKVDNFNRLPSSEANLFILYYNLSLRFPDLCLFRGDNFSSLTGWEGIDFSQGDLELVLGRYLGWRRDPVIVQIKFADILPMFAEGLLRSLGSEGHLWRDSTMVDFEWGAEYDYSNRDRILKYVKLYRNDMVLDN